MFSLAAPNRRVFVVGSDIPNYRRWMVALVRRPCEGTWRDIMEWAWDNKIEFTHNDLLDRGVVNYRGPRRKQVWSASSTLHRMHEAGLLTRLAAGRGRRASLYAPISRKEYERRLKRLVLV